MRSIRGKRVFLDFREKEIGDFLQILRKLENDRRSIPVTLLRSSLTRYGSVLSFATRKPNKPLLSFWQGLHSPKKNGLSKCGNCSLVSVVELHVCVCIGEDSEKEA